MFEYITAWQEREGGKEETWGFHPVSACSMGSRLRGPWACRGFSICRPVVWVKGLHCGSSQAQLLREQIHLPRATGKDEEPPHRESVLPLNAKRVMIEGLWD